MTKVVSSQEIQHLSKMVVTGSDAKVPFMIFIFIAFTGLILSTCVRIPVLVKCRIANAWRGKKVAIIPARYIY